MILVTKPVKFRSKHPRIESFDFKWEGHPTGNIHHMMVL